jgi:DNA adenine methylase
MVSVMSKPLLKWAGGERWLVRSHDLLIPARYGSYFEPFVGGGAVFFFLRPRTGVICDTNTELVNLYRVVRDHPETMRMELQRHQALHSKQHYYAMRAHDPECEIERAVRFLYLNRACWNGLYRVNQAGRFNVPIGTKQNILFEEDDFESASDALKMVDIKCSDFENVIDSAQAGDFIFVDPPYTVKHNFNGFLRYNERIFSWGDQERLYEALERAAARGCLITVTNADHESVRELYAKAFYRQVSRPSMIASLQHGRGAVTEAIFTFNF